MSHITQEENLKMFQELMSVPHGKIEDALVTHRKLRDKNPLFYAKMAVWYQNNGTVRDHKVAFVSALFERPEQAYRDVAWCLLQDMPFYLVSQVVRDQYPRCLRSAVIHFLASLDEAELAYHILRSAKALKRIVKRLHIPTDKRKDGSAISSPNLVLIGKELFGSKPELRGIFAKLEQATTEEEVKKLLSRKPRIPAHIAVSALRVRTPEIMKVLIKSMSANELLQSLNSLGRLRVIRPNIRLIRRKIEKAVADKRLNAARVNRIKKKLDVELVPSEIFDDLEFVTQEKVKRISKIEKQVVILPDASASMDRSLMAARQLAAMLAMACKKLPYIYTCSSTPMEITPDKWTVTGLENAMNLITPTGRTPLGSGLMIMNNQGRQAEAIILISDGGENSPPFLIVEWAKLGNQPHIIFVRVPGHNDVVSKMLKDNQIPFDKIDLDRIDQYSLDQIIKFIGKTNPFETVIEVMSHKLPTRPQTTKIARYWKKGGE